MKAAIMQPYLFPYIGYFELIAAVDLFIIYDNIKFTKKGWFHRNRMLVNGKDLLFTLPLRNDSDSLNVDQRWLAQDFIPEDLLNKFRGAYRRAPYFKETYPLLEQVLAYEDNNLFNFLHHSIQMICRQLGLSTEIRVSSSLNIDHDLKSQAKVLALCRAVGASTYVNPMGGMALYSRQDFLDRGITLKFLKPRAFEYRQFDSPFIPWLSIIDVMMFNPVSRIHSCLSTDHELT